MLFWRGPTPCSAGWRRFSGRRLGLWLRWARRMDGGICCLGGGLGHRLGVLYELVELPLHGLPPCGCLLAGLLGGRPRGAVGLICACSGRLAGFTLRRRFFGVTELAHGVLK